MRLNTNNSIQHYSSLCQQLNGSKYCYVKLTIQLNICHLFTHCSMVKEFYFLKFLSHLFARIFNMTQSQVLPTLSQSESRSKMAMKRYFTFRRTPAFLEFHRYIGFCYIHDTHCVCVWDGVLTSPQRCSRCILKHQPTEMK